MIAQSRWMVLITTVVVALAIAGGGTHVAQANETVNPALGNRLIAGEAGVYYAWPSVAQLKNGDILVVVYEGNAHTDAHGRVVLYRSSDNGQSWDDGMVVADTVLDDRDPGILVTSDDTIIVTSRVAWWQDRDQDVIDPDVARSLMSEFSGGYLVKSTDGGRTWSPMIRYPFQPKGPIELSDGSLFAVAKASATSFMAYQSPDVGDTWVPVGFIFGLPGTSVVNGQVNVLGYWEPHFIQMPSGRIIVYIRAHATEPRYGTIETSRLWATYSDDLGRTWSQPETIDVQGFPPHALLLQDGRMLLTYGYRWRPFGQRARISDDGLTFDQYPEILIRSDGFDDDLGYPTSLQLDANTILTVYYQKHRVLQKPALMATIWSLD